MKVQLGSDIKNPLALYCWKRMRRFKFGDHQYDCDNMFVRSLDKYQWVPYESINTSSVFWQGWRPLFTSIQKDSLCLSYIRGTIDIEKIFVEATKLWNEQLYTGEQKRRFRVMRWSGTFGVNTGNPGRLNEPEAATNKEPNSVESGLYTKRLLAHDYDDIGQRVHETDPLISLAFPSQIQGYIVDMER